PIDHSQADVWVTTADAPSLTLAQAIPESWLLRVAAQPEVERAEPYLLGFGGWHKPGAGGNEDCCIIGPGAGPRRPRRPPRGDARDADPAERTGHGRGR